NFHPLVHGRHRGRGQLPAQIHSGKTSPFNVADSTVLRPRLKSMLAWHLVSARTNGLHTIADCISVLAIAFPLRLPAWRNWQTRLIQVLVSNIVQVHVLSR